ncbi:MAG TPA: alpha-L-fucosidase [Gemmatimonadales bacterium]|nr:alpha-L-fucosidase [Gemmatimonadales bacterium]
MTTRREVLLAGVAALGATRFHLPQSRPVPSAAQLTWQRDELALFLHFGVNTFTDREWGDGREDPGIFAPTALDARQWARTAKAAGFRAMILTAKHHDGFCLWPSRTTRHSVASSPWRGGSGDLVREFTDACRAEGLRAGLYCSPWDRNAPAYGDSARYNDMLCDQLTELLSGYGKIHEVWFDGANGEGPNGRKQAYDWPRFFDLVKKLQPDSVIFSDAGPDVRWIGNEKGVAGELNWSTVDPIAVPYPGAEGDKVIAMLQHGDPDGSVWRPGEADVSIRPGWFHHAAEDARVKSVEELVGLYFSSVGRNSKLLLNVPPTRDGLIYAIDAERLAGMRTVLDLMFRDNHADQRRASWQRTDDRTATLTVDLGRAVNIRILDLREDITRGQVVARYAVHGETSGGWQPLSSGTTIGYRKLDHLDARDVRRLRVTIDAVDQPPPISLACFG